MSNTLYKSKYLNIYHRRTGLGFMYDTCDYDDCSHTLVFELIFISIYISLPWKSKEWTCESSTYGIETYKTVYKKWYDIFDQLYVRFGNRCWFIEMPWYLDWTYTAVQLKSKSWIVEDYKSRKNHFRFKKYFPNIFNINNEQDWKYNASEDFKSQIYYDYVYTYEPLKQTSNCRYYVCERCWRPKWFKWTDLFSLKQRVIEVEFSEGMGPNKDSWKGGTIACSFKIKDGETAEECIRRMEKEYVF